MPSFPLFQQLPGEIQNLIFEFAFNDSLPRLQPQVTTLQVNPSLGCLSSRHFSGMPMADLLVLSRDTPRPLPPLLLTCSRSREVGDAVLRRICAARLAGTHGDFLYLPAGMIFGLSRQLPQHALTFTSGQQRTRSTSERNRHLIAHATPLVLGLGVYEDRESSFDPNFAGYLMNSFHPTRMVDLTFEIVPLSRQVLTQEAVDSAFRRLSDLFALFKARRVYQNLQFRYLMRAPGRGEHSRSALERWSPEWFREAYSFVGIGSATSFFFNYDAHFLFEQGKVPLLQETMNNRPRSSSSGVSTRAPVFCTVADRIADIKLKVGNTEAELQRLQVAPYVPDYNDMMRRAHKKQMLRSMLLRLDEQVDLWNDWCAKQD